LSEYVTLKATDGFELNAYVARPEGEPIAGLVVVQEIFGVNPHIRSVADGYAKDGFLVVAPALFDRFERGVELSYEGADMQQAMSFVPKLNPDKSLEDVAAAIDFAHAATGKKVGVIGYCFGGTMAWLAATRLHPAVAVGYYGGHIANYASETPAAPVRIPIFPRQASRRCRPRIPRSRSTGTTQATASTAMHAVPTTPTPRTKPEPVPSAS